MEELKISKLDAAKRQLEVAIRLYFHFGDPVAIHTLTAAAYNVLKDINSHRGGEQVLMKAQLAKEFIRPEYQKEFIKKLNEAENFFKHANSDPEAVLKFKPRQSEFLLWEAVEIYQRLTGEITPFLHAYRGWFMMHNQPMFSNLPEAQRKIIDFLGYKKTERTAYFQEVINFIIQQGVC